MNEPLKTFSVLVLTKYGRMGASSRLRFLQYFSGLKSEGVRITVQPLLSDGLLQARYQRGSYGLGSLLRAYVDRCRALLRRRDFNAIWIEKEALPWVPLWMERTLLRGVPYVLDYDDAVFHQYDQHHRAWVRCLYGGRLDGLMAKAALVVGGNNYLAQRARDAGARWTEVVPTVIDLDRYPHTLQPPTTKKLPRIVWIGSPSTARYLHLLRGPLGKLAERQSFVLRVIGGGVVDIPGVQVEMVPWSEDTEVENIRACDVGVMPLVDSSWERGKCGYKLIQYMACDLPVVASGVGVNSEIVQHGVNGYLANTSDEWVAALDKLLADKHLRAQMGGAGRHLVERVYCIQQTGPKMAWFLRVAAGAL
ncbi:glycosyltransferase family 4 protein [Polaromonas sp. P1(28)-13]|nr:glycosyltransferase family 4 protein [Polaromonas sp. P1(28)-13]